MPNRRPPSIPTPKTRKEAVEDINRVLARLPFLVQILQQLHECHIPLPGDDDIRHGCERALTAMLSELARIEPASDTRASRSEEGTGKWLSDPSARKLIDADKLQRMQLFIDCILAPKQPRIPS